MGTALATRTEQVGAIEAIGRLSPESLAVIKSTVAQGATDHELAMFLELANRYQLDPFAREIWCICEMKNGQRVTDNNGAPKPAQIMASRDGYLAHANRHPAFDGMESDVVREGDTFKRSGGVVEHAYGAERGAIIGAYALVHRTDRSRPAYFFAPWSDYGRNATQAWSPWAKYGSAMIVKVAEAMALKRAFSISGLVTQEEMDAADPQGSPSTGLVEPAPVDPWRFRLRDLRDLATAAGLAEEDVKAAIKNAGGTKPSDLNDDDIHQKAIDEITGGEEPVEGEIVDEPQTGAAPEPPEVINEQQRRLMLALGAEAGLSKDDVKDIVVGMFGVDSTTTVPAARFDEVVEYLERMKAEHLAGEGAK